MSSIYATTISSEKYIIINSQNIELSGNIIMKEHVTISNGLLNTNSIVPNVTNSASLGSTSSSWSNAYIRDLSVNNNLQVTGNVKISENLDVSNIYTKNYIDNSFANVYTRTHIDLSFANVYNRSHIDQSFQNVYTIEQFDNLYANVYTSDHIDNSFQNVYNIEHIDNSFQNVYTRIHIDNSFTKVYTIKQFDNSYANVYTRDHVDLSFGNVYNREHVDNSFANVYTITQFDNSYADVYTIIQVDNSFAYKNIFDASYNALAIGGGGGSTSSIDLSLVSSNIIPSSTNTYNLGSTSKYWNNAYINNLRVSNRVYQEISGDISWSAVNGYYGLAKDAYPALNPSSSGALAVSIWYEKSAIRANGLARLDGICWSPELRLFVACGGNQIACSSNGITWTTGITISEVSTLLSVCWSPQLRLFAAVSRFGTFKIITSPDGITWTPRALPETNGMITICWSPELRIFVAIEFNGGMTSPDGITWTAIGVPTSGLGTICWSAELILFVLVTSGGLVITSRDGIIWNNRTPSEANDWRGVCWSPELGIFVAVARTGINRVMTSPDGINWTARKAALDSTWVSVCWCPQIRLFIALAEHPLDSFMGSPDGINWSIQTQATPSFTGGGWKQICWSPELGIVIAISDTGNRSRLTVSSLKGRPPTSYNVFDSSFNSIDETGKWTFQNMAVTTLNVTGTSTGTSDDRLKHNEVAIVNGLEIIDRLNPKFYQKTQNMLDASYNGDLSGQAWTYEAGLIAQEVLQIPDLSFAVCGGDYYQESYILNNQSNDISANANYYDISRNYYDISSNYYDISANNYEISYNLIAQPYSLNYNSIIVYGLAAIKELHAKVKAQELSLLTQQTIINTLTTRMEALETNPNNS
jgi:ASC-1-like (ASCH) protein